MDPEWCQIKRDKEGNALLHRGTTDQENISILKTYVPKLGTPNEKSDLKILRHRLIPTQ